MVIILCLPVNNLAQHTLRKGMKETGQTVLSQVKKPTQTPTLRLISLCLKRVIMQDVNTQWRATSNVSPGVSEAFIVLGKEVP